ncbi:MAG: hypothetical protein ABI721_01525 [Candidatus Dojkabacteria bacterium]
MNQKTIIAISCFILAFICGICTIGFGIIYYLMNNPKSTGPIACTLEAKMCPDGSAVGRDPLNNCEFKPCP